MARQEARQKANEEVESKRKANVELAAEAKRKAQEEKQVVLARKEAAAASANDTKAKDTATAPEVYVPQTCL